MLQCEGMSAAVVPNKNDVEYFPPEYCIRSHDRISVHRVWESVCFIYEPDYFTRKMATVYSCSCLFHTIHCHLCGNMISGLAGFDSNNIPIINHLFKCRRNIIIVGLYLQINDDVNFNLHQLLKKCPQLIYFDIDYIGILSRLDDINSVEEFMLATKTEELKCFRCGLYFDSMPSKEVLRKHISDCKPA